MEVEEGLSILDEIDKGGRGTKGPNGENSGQIMAAIIDNPGAPHALVDQYASSSNSITVNDIAFALSDLADSKTSETVNLIYSLLEQTNHWDH